MTDGTDGRGSVSSIKSDAGTMSQQTVVRLKELLFDKERSEIELLARRLEQVAERAGSDAQFRASVAQVLDGALRDAEESRHREVSDALAPLVVRTVRTEVATQQEQLPAQLYPHIGKMVRDYVTSAIRDLMADINRRLEGGLYNNRFMLKLRSLTSGRSMAELALAEHEALAVEELHLIQRGSGDLLGHWSKDGIASPDGGNRGTLFSGMLTAMTAFIEEVYEADKASLRSIDFGEHTLFLRGSPNHLMAAKCQGVASDAVHRLLDEEFLRSLETLADRKTGSASELPALAERIEQRLRAHRDGIRKSGTSRPLRAIAWLVGLPLLAWLSWSGYVRYQTAALQSAANAVIAEMPELKGYPTRARVARGGETIEVSGLAPSMNARTLIVERLRNLAPDARIVETIGVVPGASVGEIEAEMNQLRSGLSGLEVSLSRASEQRTLERAGKRLDSIMPGLAALEKNVPDAGLRSRLASSRAALASARDDIRALRGISGASTSDTKRKAELIADARERLQVGERALRSFVDPMLAAEADDAAPDGEDALVDGLALQAERIAALSIAAKARAAQQPLEQRLAELTRRLAALPGGATARQRLEAWIATHAVFFDNATDFRDDAKASATLDELATLLRDTDVGLRIVGYTDERGTVASNIALAQARAQRVATELERRGIVARRLIPVGRTGVEISNRAGVGSANRRAAFELAFVGEVE